MTVRIAAETPLQDDVRAMVASLNALYAAADPARVPVPTHRRADGRPQRDRVHRTRSNGRHVGMASLKDHGGGLGEVKRMFTLPEVRGQRIGSALLKRLEELAREKHMTRLVLETGEAPGFEAAWRVYERGGYSVCGAVLDYPDSGYSRFYEKKLI